MGYFKGSYLQITYFFSTFHVCNLDHIENSAGENSANGSTQKSFETTQNVKTTSGLGTSSSTMTREGVLVMTVAEGGGTSEPFHPAKTGKFVVENWCYLRTF